MYNLRHGISLGFTESFWDKLKQAENAGFYSIEFGICSLWSDREKEKQTYTRLREAFESIKSSPLVLNSVHISFGTHWDFSSPDESVRKEAMDNLREVLPVIDEYKPNYLVIHPSFEPIKDEEREAHKDALVRSITEIKALTSTKIALEDLPRTCLFNTAKEGLELLERIGGVCACLDTNHFLQETPQDAIKALGKHIVTTHISDYDFIDERHVMPGKGKIDWNAVLAALEEIDYDGVFNSEITQNAEIGASIADIKQCFDRLFKTYNESK